MAQLWPCRKGGNFVWILLAVCNISEKLKLFLSPHPATLEFVATVSHGILACANKSCTSATTNTETLTAFQGGSNIRIILTYYKNTSVKADDKEVCLYIMLHSRISKIPLKLRKKFKNVPISPNDIPTVCSVSILL